MKRIPKVAYTLEFKLEALRRVRGGEPVRQVGREIGVPEQSIRNWVKAQAEGKLGTAENGKPITPEQMEISRLRAENARLKMEMEIVKKPPRTLRGSRCEVRVY
jgi:transposase